MPSPPLSLVRPNARARVLTCPTCHFLHLVPPDCPVEPVCPRCLYEDIQRHAAERMEPLMIPWYWPVVTFLFGVALGWVFGRH